MNQIPSLPKNTYGTAPTQLNLRYTSLQFNIFLSQFLVPPPHHPTRPYNTFHPSAQLIYWPAVHFLCRCGQPNLNVFLYRPDPHYIQCIGHQALLPLSILCTMIPHFHDPPVCMMIETLQHFQNRYFHHPNTAII